MNERVTKLRYKSCCLSLARWLHEKNLAACYCRVIVISTIDINAIVGVCAWRRFVPSRCILLITPSNVIIRLRELQLLRAIRAIRDELLPVIGLFVGINLSSCDLQTNGFTPSSCQIALRNLIYYDNNTKASLEVGFPILNERRHILPLILVQSLNRVESRSFFCTSILFLDCPPLLTLVDPRLAL